MQRQQRQRSRSSVTITVCNNFWSATNDYLMLEFSNIQGTQKCSIQPTNTFPQGQRVHLTGQQLGRCNFNLVEDQLINVKINVVSSAWHGHNGM